jgi:hypothetical protein
LSGLVYFSVLKYQAIRKIRELLQPQRSFLLMLKKFSLSTKTRSRVLFSAASLCVLSFFWLLHFGSSNVSVAGNVEGGSTAGQALQDGPEASKPHWLVGSFYSMQNGLTATLLLNNKGNQPLEVRPTLYNLHGQALDIPPLTVAPASFRFVNLQEWVDTGGESFSQGSIKLFHVGKDLVLGAQIYLADEAHSLSFEEKLAEFGTFDSRRYEGVWWMPSRQAEVQIILSNTTDAPLSVTARLSKRPYLTGEAQVFGLAPHETRSLDVGRDFDGGDPFARSEISALSLTHGGEKSALLARAMVKDTEIGYSNIAQFSNPDGGKSREYQGVGFQIDDVGGERLVPVIVARNVGGEAATLRARVPYTRIDNTTGTVELPPTRLRAGEMMLIDTHEVTQRSRQEQIQIAGLEVKYDTAPGSVIVNAQSVSVSGNQVFRVPMWDPLGQRSPTGGYPWRIEGTSTTRTYIKNITDRRQYYVASLRWGDGEGYMLGMREVAPHQTVEIDIKRLRDEQVPDVDGRIIPAEVSSGQLMWSLKQMGPPPAGDEARQALALIGRSEQVDVERGLSSNYACQSCCTNSYYDSFLSPAGADVEVDTLVNFTVYQRDKDCYGVVSMPYPRTFFDGPVTWSSSDTETATVNASGQATAIGAGETTIRATWTDYRYDVRFAPCTYYGEGQTSPNCYDCNYALPVHPSPSATLKVKPKITGITPSRGLIGSTINVTITGRGFRSGQTSVNAGDGVTASISSVSATQIQANFSIAADTAGGNRSVTVTSRSQTSNSNYFFVQIPRRLMFYDIPGRTTNGKGPVVIIDDGDIVDLSGNVKAHNQCGVYQNVAYVLVDQEGQRIVQPFTLIEEFASNAEPSRRFDIPANKIITDIHSRSRTVPACLLFDEHDSLVQGFTVISGVGRYDLTTLVSIAVGDFTGTRNVIVEITRP